MTDASINIRDLVGKRCLMVVNPGKFNSREVGEYKVIEVSPSGQWVKIMNLYGQKYWKPVGDLALVEVLTDINAGKPL